MIEIKHKDTGEVLKRVDDETLAFTDLTGADLAFADLQWASLIDADLRSADLYGADLCGACLLYADLGEADLRCANLRQADLSHVNLRQVKLRGAQYDGRTAWPPQFRPSEHGAVERLSSGDWIGTAFLVVGGASLVSFLTVPLVHTMGWSAKLPPLAPWGIALFVGGLLGGSAEVLAYRHYH
jgi:hypothetical protein